MDSEHKKYVDQTVTPEFLEAWSRETVFRSDAEAHAIQCLIAWIRDRHREMRPK